MRRTYRKTEVPIAPENGKESVTSVKLSEVHPFEGHPYSVKDDKDMWDLVESVRRSGVIEPIMVIRDEKRAALKWSPATAPPCQSACPDWIHPVLVRDIDRDSAYPSLCLTRT